MLKTAAEENLKAWTFGGASTAEIQVTYEFTLRGPEVNYIPPTSLKFDFPEFVQVVSQPSQFDHK